MYDVPAFREARVEVLHALIRAHPLATLVTFSSDAAAGLEANHIPLLIDPAPGPDRPFGTLRGHVARANPLWRGFNADVEALAIFQGPQGYVTPSWYPSKTQHGKVVPTWNYAVVHARGTPVVLEDAASVLRIVSALTDTHEARQAHPWQVGDAPPAFVDQMLRAIVGIEIPIEQLVGKWKVSQNRSADDRAGVAAGLRAQDPTDPMAALVAPPSP